MWDGALGAVGGELGVVEGDGFAVAVECGEEAGARAVEEGDGEADAVAVGCEYGEDVGGVKGRGCMEDYIQVSWEASQSS